MHRETVQLVREQQREWHKYGNCTEATAHKGAKQWHETDEQRKERLQQMREQEHEQRNVVLRIQKQLTTACAKQSVCPQVVLLDHTTSHQIKNVHLPLCTCSYIIPVHCHTTLTSQLVKARPTISYILLVSYPFFHMCALKALYGSQFICVYMYLFICLYMVTLISWWPPIPNGW